MRAKIGTFKKIGATNYSGFKALFKKSIIDLLGDVSKNGLIDYVLVSGEHLTWKGSEKGADNPLLFLDDNCKGLIKEVKGNKDLDLKAYSYGSCRAVKRETKVTIYLCPMKGKLTQPALLKPIEKFFKSMKPKIFFEVVDNLDTIDTIAETTEKKSDLSTDLTVRASEIGQNLIKQHQFFQVISQKSKGLEKTDPKRVKLLENRKKVLQQLQLLCKAWTNEVLSQEEQLPLEENWKKLYKYWSNQFAKVKEGKEEKETTNTGEEGISEEEKMQQIAQETFNKYFGGLERGEDIDYTVIDEGIDAYEKAINEWKQIANENSTSELKSEIFAAEEQLKELKKDWEEIMPRIKEYKNIERKVEEKIQQDKLSEVIGLLNVISEI